MKYSWIGEYTVTKKQEGIAEQILFINGKTTLYLVTTTIFYLIRIVQISFIATITMLTKILIN
jgi:hypothetical protein